MHLARILTLVLPLFVFGNLASAQNFPVTPANPTEFKKRDLGGTLGSAVAGVSSVKPKTITRRYIAVSDKRVFGSSEGKEIMAQLIAFDQEDVEKAKLPLTLIRDGKIRLLVEGKQKASVVPLSRLREEDQAFVRSVEEANQAAAKQAPDEDAAKKEDEG